MKPLVYLLVVGFGLIACKPEEPSEPTIDEAILMPLLKGYFDYGPKPIDYFKAKCTERHLIIAKCFVEKKDNKTLTIQFVYVGKCSEFITNPANDYELKAVVESPMPVKDTKGYRIDFKGTINATKPLDAQLQNKQIEGFAYLSPEVGEFTFNLPVSINGQPAQIVSKMNIRSPTF